MTATITRRRTDAGLQISIRASRLIFLPRACAVQFDSEVIEWESEDTPCAFWSGVTAPSGELFP